MSQSVCHYLNVPLSCDSLTGKQTKYSARDAYKNLRNEFNYDIYDIRNPFHPESPSSWHLAKLVKVIMTMYQVSVMEALCIFREAMNTELYYRAKMSASLESYITKEEDRHFFDSMYLIAKNVIDNNNSSKDKFVVIQKTMAISLDDPQPILRWKNVQMEAISIVHNNTLQSNDVQFQKCKPQVLERLQLILSNIPDDQNDLLMRLALMLFEKYIYN